MAKHAIKKATLPNGDQVTGFVHDSPPEEIELKHGLNHEDLLIFETEEADFIGVVGNTVIYM